ncbi:MAG TPA: type II secretion system F family protein [Bacilli bacterium]|nr:type II secretion system F family protein [Bacilli bacterium]
MLVILLQFAMLASCFATVFLLVYALVERRTRVSGKRVLTYLATSGEIVKVAGGEEEEVLPLRERLWRPFLKNVGTFVHRLTPAHWEKKVQLQLNQAGNPLGLSAREFLGWSALLVGLGLLGATMLASLLGGTLGFLAWVMMVLLSLLLPRSILRSRSLERQSKVKKALPDTLDLLTVSVEAGLGFDQALQKVVEKTRGPLADEFRITLQEVQMGKARRDALKDLGERTGVEAMINFVNALIQADKLGVGIGNVLRVQSEDMRSRRRLEAEEKAMKAPIKMLFPLIFFIFPALFVIILGPAVLQLIDMFTGL